MYPWGNTKQRWVVSSYKPCSLTACYLTVNIGKDSVPQTLLEKVDHQVMKIICDGHSKTPTEFLYLETGATPLKDIVASRRIMYLHNI